MELLLTGAVNRLLARFVKSAGGEAGGDLRVSLGASGTVVRPFFQSWRTPWLSTSEPSPSSAISI